MTATMAEQPVLRLTLSATALFWSLVAPLAAAVPGDLYTAIVFVTGQGEENRAAGFAKAMEEVLHKVSGDPRLLDDPRVAAAAAKASDSVASFSYRDLMEGIPVHDEQGTRQRPFDLTVKFAPKRIDTTLRSLGREPWTKDRPRVVVLVSVSNRPMHYLLAGNGRLGRDLRDALAVEARRVGLTVLLPSEADLAEAGLTIGTLPSAEPAHFDAAARAAGGEVALTGSLTWSDEAHGWQAAWHFDWNDVSETWLLTGVSFDAAFRNGLRGAAQIMSGNGKP